MRALPLGLNLPQFLLVVIHGTTADESNVRSSAKARLELTAESRVGIHTCMCYKSKGCVCAPVLCVCVWAVSKCVYLCNCVCVCVCVCVSTYPCVCVIRAVEHCSGYHGYYADNGEFSFEIQYIKFYSRRSKFTDCCVQLFTVFCSPTP